MAMRSWLFVPGDSEAKLGKVGAVGADVVVVDLEDAVASHAKANARQMAARWLTAHGKHILSGAEMQRWVRINPLDGHMWREDLAAVMPGRPHGVMVPKAAGPEQLRLLAAELYEYEQRNGIEPGSTSIVPLVSETAKAALSIASYAQAEAPRLSGLTWGAEDLSSAISATRKRTPDGEWTDLFRMVRSQVLLTAHARAIAAIDTLHADFRDLDGLKRIARDSYSDGFSGMMAIHPDQVAIINAAFQPSHAELEDARAIVDAFAASPGAGTVQVDGRMVDQPHLQQARRLLERTS